MTAAYPQQYKPKIVLVDDEEIIHQLVELFFRDYFEEVTLLKFRNRDDAWKELSKADPDLLITDMRNDNIPTVSGLQEDLGISGFELLKLLATKRVKYPILVISGCFSISGLEGYAKKCAGRDLNVSYLTKPFTKDLFHQGLLKCLGPNSRTAG